MLKVIHTADWHLGKKLENIDRHDEQVQVLEEFIDIVNQKEPDLIIIAGDIFDSVNPPAQSETLFYDTLNNLINPSRLIVIVSGNHDNYLRLSATKNLLLQHNILFFETPDKLFEIKNYHNFKIISSYPGGVKLNFKDQNIYLNTLSYPTETNLNINFEKIDNYSEYITDLLKIQNSNFKNDGYLINIAHLFIGQTSTTLGGSRAVNIHDFQKVDYTAVGHIHKSQIYTDYNLAYSGSILEYRVSEINNPKVIIYATLHGNLDSKIEKINLTNNFPIKDLTFTMLSDLLSYLENSHNEYLYLTLLTQTALNSEQRKQIVKYVNVISLTIKITSEQQDDIIINENLDTLEQFKLAYELSNNKQISQQELELFEKLLKEVENETT